MGGYGILKALQSLYPHFGQSKVRLSYPGLPGSECVKTICTEHFGQLSRRENAGICAVGFASGMRDPPVTGGSTTGLSAIDAREASLSMMVSVYDSGRSGVECLNRRGSLNSAAQQCLSISAAARLTAPWSRLDYSDWR